MKSTEPMLKKSIIYIAVIASSVLLYPAVEYLMYPADFKMVPSMVNGMIAGLLFYPLFTWVNKRMMYSEKKMRTKDPEPQISGSKSNM